MEGQLWFKKALVLLIAAGVAGAVFINVCDLFYQCGCRSWWNGAAQSCNIHTPNVPHCPWCVSGGAWGYLSFGLIVLMQAMVAFRPSPAGFVLRLLLALLAFPVVGGILALIFGWYTGYWTG
jgi:hypothetical protein